MATSANFAFANQSGDNLSVNQGASFEMSTLTTPDWGFQGGQTQQCTVAASDVPGQSWFSVIVNTGPSLAFNLGIWPNNTSVLSSSASSQLAGFVAPNSPFTTGPGFDLYAFYSANSTSTLTAYVNALIQANAVATMQALAALKPQFGPKGETLVLNSLTGLDGLNCTYANIDFGDTITFTVILQLPSLAATFTSPPSNADITLSVTSLQLLLEGTVTLTGTTPGLSLTTLQCSFASWSPSGAFLSFLESIPGLSLLVDLGLLTATAANVAGLLNDTYNSAILNYVNSQLSGISSPGAKQP